MTLLIDIPSCVYCGSNATSRDHFIPIAKLRPTDVNYELPCCTSCNSAARDRYFETFTEKATWLLTKALRTNRVNLISLNLFAPLVVEALSRHDTGKNSVHQNVEQKASGCAVCGSKILQRKQTRKRKYCGARCSLLGSRDLQRIAAQHKITKP